jgi:hypothetical protein
MCDGLFVIIYCILCEEYTIVRWSDVESLIQLLPANHVYLKGFVVFWSRSTPKLKKCITYRKEQESTREQKVQHFPISITPTILSSLAKASESLSSVILNLS